MIRIQPGQTGRFTSSPEKSRGSEVFRKTYTQQPVAKPGLGDRLEKILKTVGITPERYKELKTLLHFKPTCGCPARKEFLNRAPSRAIKGFLRNGAAGAYDALAKLADEINTEFKEKSHG